MNKKLLNNIYIICGFTFIIFFLTRIAYTFNYEMEVHAQRNIIKSFPLSDNKKFISFTLNGTFSDNLGNYGQFEQASTLIIENKKVLKLDSYGKSIYQNREEVYFRGYRSKQEKNSGVGQTITLNATKPLKILIGMECNYAVKFFNDIAYVLSKCKITEEQKKLLSNITQ